MFRLFSKPYSCSIITHKGVNLVGSETVTTNEVIVTGTKSKFSVGNSIFNILIVSNQSIFIINILLIGGQTRKIFIQLRCVTRANFHILFKIIRHKQSTDSQNMCVSTQPWILPPRSLVHQITAYDLHERNMSYMKII